jgi:hypothetical protein
MIFYRFLRVDYGQKLREFLLKNVKIDKIVDFGDTKVFADATNYPAIIIFEKKSVEDHEFTYIEVNPKANELNPQEVINLVKSYKPESKEYLSITRLNQNKLSTLSAWIPSQIFIDTKIRKIKNVRNLKDLTKEIMEGITFGGKGSDDIFVVDKKTIKNYRIESKIYKKVLKGRDIRKWRLQWDQRYVLYPYDANGKEINLEDYPNGNEYLKQFQDTLSTRILDGKNITKWGKQWFSFWRSRNPKVFNKQKILCPRISVDNNFSLDKDGEFYFTDSAVAILSKDLDLKYLLGVLNSKLIFYVIKNTSPFVQGRYYSFTRTYLEKLPIKIPTTVEEKEIANKIIIKVDKILQLGKSLRIDIYKMLDGEKTDKLSNLPKIIFSVRDKGVIKNINLDNYKLFINDEDYIEIKDKYLLKYVKIYLKYYLNDSKKIDDVKSFLINIPVPKSPETLNEIIDKGDIEHIKIDDHIEKLEQEINNLICELYGLNKKEIEIIESNFFFILNFA